MYSNLRIQNYRGLEDLTLTSLGRINLIVGGNDVGKSSVLEALALLHMHTNFYELTQILESRGYVAGESMYGSLSSMYRLKSDPWFSVVASTENQGWAAVLGTGRPQLPISREFEQRNALDGLEIGTVQPHVGFPGEQLDLAYYRSKSLRPGSIQLHSNGQVSLEQPRSLPQPWEKGAFGDVVLLPSVVRLRNRYLPEFVTDLRRKGRIKQVIEALRQFDDRLRDISLAVDNGQTTIDISIETSPNVISILPMSALGDGVRRLWEILVLIPRASEGVALIDEIETGIYYENMPRLWSAIDAASLASDVQVFITTHSLECVDAVITAFEHSGSREDFMLHRLERDGDSISSVTYSFNDLVKTRALNWEFR